MASAHFVERINRVFSFEMWEATPVVVAVSGGPDSVALLRGMLKSAEQAGYPQPKNLFVAHIDHGLRGKESDSDVVFVESLAAEHGLHFQFGSIAPESDFEKSLKNSEESLRNFRYEQLLKIASKVGARYIVTGHNLDDQFETILFRIFRGTGIGGLAGIPTHRLGNDSVTIIRPLLEIRRSEILAFLDSIGQTFRVDSSNSSSRYTRNYLRNELIPAIERRFGPNVSASVLRLGGQAAELNKFVSAHSNSLGNAIVEQKPRRLKLDCRKLKENPDFLVRQFLTELWTKQSWPKQDMTFQWWSKICSAIKNEPAPEPSVLNLPGNIRFERGEDFATFEMPPPLAR